MDSNGCVELPKEILERKIFPYLPIATVCRCRAVSKEWRKWIDSAEFAPLHSRFSPRQELILTTSRRDCILFPKGWTVFDVANGRFFTLNDDFLTSYITQEIGPRNLFKSFEDRITVAADGGIILMAYYTGSKRGSVILAVNPILRTIKRLPSLWYHWGVPKVVMRAMGSGAMGYEIFAFHAACNREEDVLHIYESQREELEWLCIRIPMEFKNVLRYATSVFLNNRLCSIFKRSDHSEGIFIYDRLTGVFSDSGVAMPWRGDNDDQEVDPAPPAGEKHLVVTQERLYYVTIDWEASSLDIFEIFLAEKDCVWVAKMPSHFLIRLLSRHDEGADVIAVGCAHSHALLICSVTGLTVLYDFARNEWDLLPDNNLIGYQGYYDYLELNSGSNNCLSLRAP